VHTERDVKHLKKILALAMTAAVLLTGSSAVASEADIISEESGAVANTRKAVYYDVENSSCRDSIYRISELGVVTGYPDGTFRPYSGVTRAELAVLMSRFLSCDHYAKAIMTAETGFSDVRASHWASREIKFFTDTGVFNGYGDGRFGPEDFVTYEQTLKILVEGMGFGKEAESKGGYPTGYRMVAVEKGLSKGITSEEEKNFNREIVAKLLDAALEVRMQNGRKPIELFGEDYFYVSPDGDDKNPGTEERPWKTMKKAAQSVLPGTTAIFEDGVYNESSVTTFTYSGTEDKPIVLKSRNKHGAKIRYAKTMKDVTKMQITDGLEYISVCDLWFDQEAKSTSNTSDIYIRLAGAENCSISGNKFTNMFEEAIKLYNSHYIMIEDNVIIEPNHEGMDIFASSYVTIRGNDLDDCGRVGFMLKGNTYNSLVYNNYIHNETVKMMTTAITLGGSSDNYSPFDVAKGTGFENYYTICYNNIVVSAQKGLIPNGIGFISSKGCQAWNNIVVNCETGFAASETDGLRKGWGWDPPVIAPVMKNNIIIDCDNGVKFSHVAENPDFENNLFCNVKNKVDFGGFEGEANVVDAYSDWHLLEGSDAIDRGIPMPEEFIGYRDMVIKADLVDYDGNPRTGTWDLGIYNVD